MTGRFVPPPEIEGVIINQYPHYVIVDKEKGYHRLDDFETIDDWTSWNPVRSGNWLDDKIAIGFKNKQDRLTFILKYVGDGAVETN